MDPAAVVEAWLAGKDTETRRAYLTDVGDPRLPPGTGRLSFLHFMTGPGLDPWHAQPFHVLTWLSQWRDAGHASVRRRTSALSSFYDTAVDLGACAQNPVGPEFDRTHPDTGPRLTPVQMAALREAADAWTGGVRTPAPQRDRLLTYLLLDGWRPGQISSQLIDRHFLAFEQHRVTAKVAMKGGGWKQRELAPATATALRAYLPVRTWRPPHSYEESGPLLTSRTGRPLDARETPRTIVRNIAATHPALAHLAPILTADTVAHSPSPLG